MIGVVQVLGLANAALTALGAIGLLKWLGGLAKAGKVVKGAAGAVKGAASAAKVGGKVGRAAKRVAGARGLKLGGSLTGAGVEEALEELGEAVSGGVGAGGGAGAGGGGGMGKVRQFLSRHYLATPAIGLLTGLSLGRGAGQDDREQALEMIRRLQAGGGMGEGGGGVGGGVGGGGGMSGAGGEELRAAMLLRLLEQAGSGRSLLRE